MTKKHLEERSGDVDSRIQVEGWRKMEAAAQNRAGCREEWSVTVYVLPGGKQGLYQVSHLQMCILPVWTNTLHILINSPNIKTS